MPSVYTSLANSQVHFLALFLVVRSYGIRHASIKDARVGFLVERWGWPSVFWLLFAIGCCLLLLVFFAMEETYRDESVWGPGDGHDPAVEDIDEKAQGTPPVTEEKMLNPFASLVSLIYANFLDI